MPARRCTLFSHVIFLFSFGRSYPIVIIVVVVVFFGVAFLLVGSTFELVPVVFYLGRVFWSCSNG